MRLINLSRCSKRDWSELKRCWRGYDQLVFERQISPLGRPHFTKSMSASDDESKPWEATDSEKCRLHPDHPFSRFSVLVTESRFVLHDIGSNSQPYFLALKSCWTRASAELGMNTNQKTNRTRALAR